MKMQNDFMMALAGLIALSTGGCGLELLGTTAVRQGLDAENTQQTTHTLQQVRGPAITETDKENLRVLQQAIRRYAEARQAYPPNLDALRPAFLMRIPQTSSGGAFSYDPRTGGVWHPEQPPPRQRGAAAGSVQPMQRQGGLGGAAGAAKQKRDRTYDQMLDELGS